MRRIHPVLRLLWDTVRDFQADHASLLGAGIAFYAIFSVAPLVVILVSMVGLLFGEEAAHGELAQRLERLVGADTAATVSDLVARVGQPGSGWAAVVGAVVLFLTAARLFAQLQIALNLVWNVRPRPLSMRATLGAMLWKRALTFVMVLAIGALLLASFVARTALYTMSRYFERYLPAAPGVWQVAEFAVSFGVATVLFALLFKLLPDARTRWRDVWVGSAVTALLFAVGAFLVGRFVTRPSAATPYGAAGSLVILLLWVYWSAQLFLLGAEFTQMYARSFGGGVQPDERFAEGAVASREGPQDADR